jgi:hypothetical protein
MGKLLDRAKEPEKIWKPTKQGEALEGVLVKIRQVHFGRVLLVRGFAQGSDGSPSHDRETNWLVNVGKESTLSARIDDAGAREGIGIAILFKGTGTSKSGREFKSWSVAVDDEQRAPGGEMNGKDQRADDTIPC